MQRKTIYILLFIFMLTACGGGEEESPALLPTLASDESVDSGSPRLPGAPDSQIPPTWTPSSPVVAPTRLTPPPETGSSATASDTDIRPEPGDEVYVVQAGDTLAEIAEDFGVDLDLLADVNAIENIDVIEVGQELIIPAP